MNARAFYELTKEMRNAQRMYFSAKDSKDKQYWLVKSKSLEGKIDAEIDRVEAILAKKNKEEKIVQKDETIGRAIKMLNDKGFGLVSEADESFADKIKAAVDAHNHKMKIIGLKFTEPSRDTLDNINGKNID